MKGLRITFWVYAIIISLGSILNMDEGLFDVYGLITLVMSWLAVYYAENK